MGIDKQINYQKLASAADFVRKGATFISTNKDLSLPSEDGIKPGNGALTSVVALSSGVEPLYIGKPAKSMIKIGLEMLRSEEHTSELQSRGHLVCRLLLEKKKNK